METWAFAFVRLALKRIVRMMGTMQDFPNPDATREEVDVFVNANQPVASSEIQHEAPPVENGPSIVCNACGVVHRMCANCNKPEGMHYDPQAKADTCCAFNWAVP